MKTNKSKQYKQLVMMSYNNGGDCLHELVSDKPITMEIAAEYFEDKDEVDWERDSMTFLDKPIRVKI